METTPKFTRSEAEALIGRTVRLTGGYAAGRTFLVRDIINAGFRGWELCPRTPKGEEPIRGTWGKVHVELVD